MIAYIKGKITQINIDSLLIENNGLGYEVFFTDFGQVSLNQEILLYTYHKIAEDDQSLYGFLRPSQLAFFKQLLSVKGIGVKSAMNILAQADLEQLLTAILSNDLDYLKGISGIGNKSAAQIILDLQGKLALSNEAAGPKALNRLAESLRALGYKNAEISSITAELTDIEGLDEAAVLMKALQLLAKRRG